MFDAMSIGATGMQAQQFNVDTIANNLANVNTSGFKKGRVSFTDLMASQASNLGLALAGRAGSDGAQEAGGVSSLPRMGAGVGVSCVTKLFDLGSINQTGSQWDVAIQGDGFIPVSLTDGTVEYSRGGTLRVNSDGLLTTLTGQVLKPAISVPANATGLTVADDGAVYATLPGQEGAVHLGQIALVRFANPSALVAQGDNLYRASEGSGEALPGTAGQENLGTFRQKALEGSNVKLVDEMVNLMVAQRAYEASVKVVQASDELLGMVNNLRK